jgi:LmbE family N-acetylglucosaminyl deacetylase
VIACHIDDETLGCSSILDSNSFVYFCGVDEHHVIPRRERLKEAEAVSKYFGYPYAVLLTSQVNHYDCRDFIPRIERIINVIKPEEIYIPYPSYNQDHQEIHKACIIALRPHDKNFFVKKVFVYEEVDTLWNSNFEANYFVPVDIERKIEGYHLHKSQVRPHRSTRAITAMAILNGEKSHYKTAEGFMIKRFVI